MSKEHLGKEINNLFNIMSKERCEIHPVKEKNIITNITGILCTLKRILRVITEILRAEISFSARHQGVNDILALKSMTVSSFFDCQKHEDITVKTLQRDEKMKTLQCLHFLSITHDVMT